MFLLNLNVFVACFILLAKFAGSELILVASILLSPRGQALNSHAGLMYPIAYLLFALLLIAFWIKTGLSPAWRKPECERRYRIGHWLIGITNVMTIAAFALPFLLAHFSGNPNFVMLTWFALPVYAFGLFVWAAGLFMIWSSRA